MAMPGIAPEASPEHGPHLTCPHLRAPIDPLPLASNARLVCCTVAHNAGLPAMIFSAADATMQAAFSSSREAKGASGTGKGLRRCMVF
jgi:hypothetical protein